MRIQRNHQTDLKRATKDFSANRNSSLPLYECIMIREGAFTARCYAQRGYATA